MFDRFRGVLPKAVGEGTHFLVPFIQNPTIYDIRTRPKSITSVTGTKDLQQVNLTLRVLHRPDVEQLLTMRDEVSRRVSFALRKRATDFGIVLEDVALTHLSFGVEYSRAIEAKQVSQQDAERSKFVVLRSEQEREAAIIRAEGESESARLISQATKSAGPALVELRRIEAAREVAQTLSRSRNVMYLPGGNANMLLGVNP